MLKRWSMLVIVLTLALGSVGVWTVGAADDTPVQNGAAQNGGGAWLGIQVRDADNGAEVMSVISDSPAETAGLQEGDVITAVEDTAVDSAQALTDAIQGYQPGDEVTLTVLSGDESREVAVTLGERPASLPGQGPMGGQGHMWGDGTHFRGMWRVLGVTAERTDEGLQITALDEDSPLADLGFQEGDVITAVNGTPLDDLNMQTLMETLHDGGIVTVTVQRDGQETTIEVDLSAIDLPDFDFDFDFNMPDMPNMPNGEDFFMQMMPAMGGSLGVSFVTLNADVAAERELDVTEGALIEEVQADSPASEAGLQVGDIVTAVDGEPVDEEHTLRDRIAAYEEDDVITLSVTRDGASQDIEVTLGPARFGQMMGQGMMPFFYMVPGAEEFFQGHMNPMGPNNGQRQDNDNQQPDSAPADSGTAA